jgi:hypothetical protein
MASSKIMIALLFAFALVSETLPPSVAVRVPEFKAANENHEADGGLLHPSAASGGSPATPAMPGLPGLFPPLPGLGAMFPPLPGLGAQPQPLPGGLGGLIAGILFPPLLPLLPLLPQPQQLGSNTPQPTECMTPLMGMAPCTDYLTNLTVLTPPGTCCAGLKKVISDAPICLCHGLNGGLNILLPKPVDPVRMTVLPLACGTVLPLQTIFMCSCELNRLFIYVMFILL